MIGNGFGNNFMNNPYCPMPSGYNNQQPNGNGPNTGGNSSESKLYMYYNNTDTIIPQDGRMYSISIKEIHNIGKDAIKINRLYKLDLHDPNNIQNQEIIKNRTIVFDRWMFIFMMKVYACIVDYIKFIGGLGHRNLQLEDLNCAIKSITCAIDVQGKQTYGSKIIINLTDEEIEIVTTNNIFDVNSLPLSTILKNNVKSTK